MESTEAWVIFRAAFIVVTVFVVAGWLHDIHKVIVDQRFSLDRVTNELIDANRELYSIRRMIELHTDLNKAYMRTDEDVD